MTNDWRYTDERMQLRQETFLKLKNHFNLKEVQLYMSSVISGLVRETTPQKMLK